VKRGEFAKITSNNAEGVEQNAQIIGKFSFKNDLFNTFGVVKSVFYFPRVSRGAIQV
jgi:hypothetical protein